MGCAVKKSNLVLPNKLIFSVDLEDYLYLVEAISKKFNIDKVEKIRDSDMFGFLSQELVSCASRYIPQKGAFDKYASCHLFNKAIEYMRRAKRQKRSLGVGLESLPVEQLEDFRKESFLAPLPIGMLSVLLSDNPSESDRDIEDKKILKEFYLDGKTVVELSKLYKTTRVTIYSRIKKSIKKIREKHVGLLELWKQKEEIF